MDYYLDADKFRLQISASGSAVSNALRKLDVKKLRSQRSAEAFSAQLSDKLRPSVVWALLRKQSLISSTHPNVINGTMRSITRQLQRKMPHAKKHCSQPLHEPLSRTARRKEGKRDAFSNARRGSRKGLSVRKSRCTDVKMTLENSIKSNRGL